MLLYGLAYEKFSPYVLINLPAVPVAGLCV
jgi:hypothetical protein